MTKICIDTQNKADGKAQEALTTRSQEDQG